MTLVDQMRDSAISGQVGHFLGSTREPGWSLPCVHQRIGKASRQLLGIAVSC